jgi:rhodanese-related sulfurtransferase
MISIFIILLLIIIGFLYIRYMPVTGVECSDIMSDADSVKILDVRDYNVSYKDPILHSINIPIGYMKRYYHEINHRNIYIVASNQLEKNMSIRFLRKKGYKVLGYTLTDCGCN